MLDLHLDPPPKTNKPYSPPPTKTKRPPAGGSAASGPETSTSTTTAPRGLPHKNDLVVWLRLKPLQRAVYTAFLNSDAVKRALNETDSPLASLTVLKKICDHPALLSERAAGSVIAGSHRWAAHTRVCVCVGVCGCVCVCARNCECILKWCGRTVFCSKAMELRGR